MGAHTTPNTPTSAVLTKVYTVEGSADLPLPAGTPGTSSYGLHAGNCCCNSTYLYAVFAWRVSHHCLPAAAVQPCVTGPYEEPWRLHALHLGTL